MDNLKIKLFAILIIILGLYNIISAITILPFHFIFIGVFAEAVIVISGFSSLLVGFLLTVVGYGLYQEYRFFYFFSMILLLASAFTNLFEENVIGTLISSFLLAAIFLERESFSRPLPVRIEIKHIIAFWIIVFVLVYGIIGALYLGNQYEPPIETIIQALYYSVITVTTVGYGDYIPTTDQARLFTISLIFIGVGSFLSAIAIIFQPLMKKLEKEAQVRINSDDKS
ncbi:ion channel [[Eubacterium] cellulosolvens]